MKLGPFRRFHHVVVGVADPDAAARDWARVFGTPILDGRDGPRIPVGDAWIELTSGERHGTGVVRVAVEVNDAAALAGAARAAGVAVGRHEGHVLVELNGVRIELREDDGRAAPPADVVFTRFHHVVVAVADDAAAVRRWGEVFAFTPAPEGPDGRVVSHHVPVGDAWFGLTSAGTDADAVARFVARRGEGVYALALVAPDRGALAARVTAAGGRLIGQPSDFQTFVHPATTHGVLLELA